MGEKINAENEESQPDVERKAGRGAALDFEAMRGDGTHRGLKSRHIQLIALGGVIGTGLFVGSGVVLSLVGPGMSFFGVRARAGG